MQPNIQSSRRVRRVAVSEATMLDVFAMLWVKGEAASPANFQLAPPFPPLPPGCRLLATQPRWESRTIEFLVENPAFEEVPDGEMVPLWDQREADQVACPPKTIAIFDESEGVSQRNFISQRELDRLAGQKCPITRDGKVVGEATDEPIIKTADSRLPPELR